jgi:hypothetical protein
VIDSLRRWVSSFHFQRRGVSISPSMEKLHSCSGVYGVGPAERTGKSVTTSRPGGGRSLCSGVLRRPRKPREMRDKVMAFLVLVAIPAPREGILCSLACSYERRPYCMRARRDGRSALWEMPEIPGFLIRWYNPTMRELGPELSTPRGGQVPCQ